MIGMTKRRGLLSGSSALAVYAALATLPCVTVAHAQGAADDSKATPVEEVVVTAQKRPELARDVPASISALSGAKLEQLNATQLMDYANYMPGFNITTGGTPGQADLIFRGVSSFGGGATVGTYIDDAPVGASGAYARSNLFQLDLFPYDIDHVEVLRGPQGTLWGADAMGGILRYVTKSPDLSTFDGRIGGDVFAVSGASDAGWGVRGEINAPLVKDEVGLRISAFKEYTPGYINNPTTGQKDDNAVEQDGARVSLLFKPNDAFSLKLAAMVQNIYAQGLSAEDVARPPAPNFGQPDLGDLEHAHLAPEPFQQRTQYYSADLNWNIGWADFVSATSYSHNTTAQTADITFAFNPALFGDPGDACGL